VDTVQVWFYERLLGHTALLARARACIQSLRDAAIPEAVGSAEATGGEGRESGGGAMDGREASSRRRGGDVVDAGCEVDLGAGEEAGGSRGVRIGASSGRGAGVVGVHVRYTDNFHDRNKVENGLLTDIGEFVVTSLFAIDCYLRGSDLLDFDSKDSSLLTEIKRKGAEGGACHCD